MSTFSTASIVLVDSIKQLLLFRETLHQVYCGTNRTPEDMVDLLEHGALDPPLDLGVDARAVCDALVAGDCCEPAGRSSNVHLTSVR